MHSSDGGQGDTGNFQVLGSMLTQIECSKVLSILARDCGSVILADHVAVSTSRSCGMAYQVLERDINILLPSALALCAWPWHTHNALAFLQLPAAMHSHLFPQTSTACHGSLTCSRSQCKTTQDCWWPNNTQMAQVAIHVHGKHVTCRQCAGHRILESHA